jgi:hypothetical protein
MQEIDLPPHKWVSDRPKQKEPIFGPGWPIAVAVIVGLFIAAYFADGSGHVPIWASIAAVVGAYAVIKVSADLKR